MTARTLTPIPGAPQALLDIIEARRSRIPEGMRMSVTPEVPDAAPGSSAPDASAPPAPPAPATPPQSQPAPAAPETGGEWKEKYEAALVDVDKWKGLSRKHERRQLEALGFDADAADKILAARQENPKLVADKVAGYDSLAQRIETMESDLAAARAEAEVSRAAADHHVAPEDAALLVGLTGDTLKALAKRLGNEQKLPHAPAPAGVAGNVGSVIDGPKQIATREEYAALSPEERRKARQDGRTNKLLGISTS